MNEETEERKERKAFFFVFQEKKCFGEERERFCSFLFFSLSLLFATLAATKPSKAVCSMWRITIGIEAVAARVEEEREEEEEEAKSAATTGTATASAFCEQQSTSATRAPKSACSCSCSCRSASPTPFFLPPLPPPPPPPRPRSSALTAARLNSSSPTWIARPAAAAG